MIRDILEVVKDFIVEKLKSRLFYVTLFFICLFGILVYRLFDLQIVNGEKYQSSFQYKSLKTVSVKATRGKIFDCNGKLLAYNEASYNLSFTSNADLTEAAAAKNMSVNELRNEIVYKTILILEKNGDSLSVELPIKLDSKGNMKFTISGAQLNTFYMNVYGASSVDDLKNSEKNATAREVFDYMKSDELFNVSQDYSDAYVLKILAVRYEVWLNRYQQYMTVDIANNISQESYAAITENMDTLLGMDVSIESNRVYNDSVYFSHIIGYIGNISTEEMDEYNAKLDDDQKYSSNDMVGKLGLEQTYEEQLRGVDGSQKMYVDNMGKVIEMIDQTESVAGNDIYLTLDSDLQKYCYNAIEKELASIILTNMKNVTSSTEKEDIPITDVYSALFDNNIIDIKALNAANATDTERNVYDTFVSSKQYTIDNLSDILKNSHTELYNLSDQYKDYMEFICETLSSKGIYDSASVDKDSDVYNNYINDKISLYEYLKYCISQGVINIKDIDTSSDYYDTDEIYDVVVDYVLKEFEDDSDFDKLIFKYMILSGEITGSQVIYLLYDQGILNSTTDEDYEAFTSGVLGGYEFMYRKIKKLEITPAMLALDPCSGSIVVTDPSTGDVKAMAVYPSYDNNRLTNVIDSDYYDKITQDKTTPMYNRATMQRTAPGSTYKMLVAAAGLKEGAIDVGSVITDYGTFSKVTPSPACWLRSGHGTLGLAEAIEVSCNGFFFEVGYRLATDSKGVYQDAQGIDTLQKYASLFGLDQKSGVEIEEMDPHVSDTDAVRSSIGQGTNNYAPVQLARYVTTIANEGNCYNLTLVNEIKNVDGRTVYASDNVPVNKVELSDTQWEVIKQGMRLMVSDHTSPSALINQINVNVAGKTGTAEEDTTRPDHALFVSFAPYENPEVSVTCVIPHGYTSGNAEELAGMVYAYMYDPDKLDTLDVTGNNQISD
ncbi:MAG: penicillin-binding transpeptidase domain-containing protein [Clostridiales bacterium]|nr:penicillin-binding transpeptidase domain-containing protein [Clostridiales bacterium]